MIKDSLIIEQYPSRPAQGHCKSLTSTKVHRGLVSEVVIGTSKTIVHSKPFGEHAVLHAIVLLHTTCLSVYQ